jgi:hypothetical protein
VGITDLVVTVEGTVLVAAMEEAALEATTENWVLVGIREEVDLVAAMVGLVLEEEIAEVGMALQVVRSTGEVALELEAV